MLRIKRYTNTEDWENEWSYGFSVERITNQYLALKLANDLCWIEISISALDGNIETVNSNCVSSGDLIIGE